MRNNYSWLAFGVIGLLTWSTDAASQDQKITLSQVPIAVKQALETHCPNCKIHRAAREVENGVTIYDFEFKDGKGEMDVTEGGLVVSRETVVQENDVPTPAREAIRNAAEGGRIVQILKETVTADLVEGKVLKLATAKYLYEADLVKGAQTAEIVVSSDGQVAEAPVWRKKGTRQP